jgi:hypothetical protein
MNDLQRENRRTYREELDECSNYASFTWDVIRLLSGLIRFENYEEKEAAD